MSLTTSIPNVFSVLIVDDNAAFVRHISRFLGRLEFLTVGGTANGALLAIEKAKEIQPDLILLDLTMPGMSGFDALSLLKSAAPEARIIVLSMHDDPPIKERVLNLGADLFVSKIEMLDMLVPSIKNLFGIQDDNP